MAAVGQQVVQSPAQQKPVLQKVEGGNNPLLGGSEGKQLKRVYQNQYLDFAFSKQEGSLNSVEKRRKSPRRLTQISDSEGPEVVSLVDKIMQSPTKQQVFAK